MSIASTTCPIQILQSRLKAISRLSLGGDLLTLIIVNRLDKTEWPCAMRFDEMEDICVS